MIAERTLELSIEGMDCAECAIHVQKALTAVPGVTEAEVYLVSEKAVVQLEDAVDMPTLQQAVSKAGYSISDSESAPGDGGMEDNLARFAGRITVALFVFVILIIVVGEWLGLFDALMERVPLVLGVLVVIAAGYPIFRKVIHATIHKQVLAHSLMTIGVLAALIAGQWITGLLVVFFMRVGDYIERFTTDQARQAIRELSDLAPKKARILKGQDEIELPINQVMIGDMVIVRPGEKIPVDGEVIDGHATVEQAAITGESMPIEVGPGSSVFAATITLLGSLRIETIHVGQDTTFGKIIQLVEEAEANKAEVQRLADRFTGYYLPIVVAIAALTLFISRDPMATVSVLVVACSCAIALATPIAMLASIGSASKKGLMIKGGKYIETLDKADVLLIDKTGTLTLGQPKLSDIVSLNGIDESELLALVCSAERYSEHPVAIALRTAARHRDLQLIEPSHFESIPGQGIRAEIAGSQVIVGNKRLVRAGRFPEADTLEAQGKTLIYVLKQGILCGILAVTDTLRPEVPEALDRVRKMGLTHIELLTGDNERSAAALAGQLGLRYRSELLPEDKIAIVKEYQRLGHTVVMVGDGVNDAPALAQADVGVTMGVAGTDVAFEASHVALMREDWDLVPELFVIARRTMRVVKLNLGFTGLYNIVGLGLAAAGILPPVLAAAAQSLPDLGILANSSRLLRR